MKDMKQLIKACPPDAWLVGGFLRDAMLERPTSDADVVVPSDPKNVARRFAAAQGGHFFPLDEERGTYRVVVAGGDGKITFDFCRRQGKTIEDDLLKRDFTINAMGLSVLHWGESNWKRKVLDPTGGFTDLKQKKIRRISVANLKEDPLRILRAFRFMAELGFGLTPETWVDVKKGRAWLKRSAPERVREEMLYLLASPRAADTLREMDRAGVLAVVFPEVEPLRRTGFDYYGKGGVLAHSIAAVKSLEKLLTELPRQFPAFHKDLSAHLNEVVGQHPRYAHLKLVELFHDIGKPATAKKEGGKLHFYGHDAVGARMVEKIAGRLRFSSGEARSLSRQVGAHMRPGNLGHQPVLSDRAIYRFFRDLEGDAVGLLIVALGDHFTYLSPRARNGRKDPVYRTIRKLLETYFLKHTSVEPPKIIDGNDVMKSLKLKPGPEVGRLLAAVREAQAAGEVKTKKEALALAKTLLA
jgi:poly(A) polymerase